MMMSLMVESLMTWWFVRYISDHVAWICALLRLIVWCSCLSCLSFPDVQLIVAHEILGQALQWTSIPLKEIRNTLSHHTKETWVKYWSDICATSLKHRLNVPIHTRIIIIFNLLNSTPSHLLLQSEFWEAISYQSPVCVCLLMINLFSLLQRTAPSSNVSVTIIQPTLFNVILNFEFCLGRSSCMGYENS